MNHSSGLKLDALILPVNDILVDVSLSYRQVVLKTVQLYLERALGLPPSSQALLTSDEITLLQKAGNFTSYWDLAKALTMYFLEMLPPVPTLTFPSKLHVPALFAYLQMSGAHIKIPIDDLRQKKDIATLAHNIATVGGGIEGAHQVLPKINRHLLVASRDITKTNLVGRIFQELYLGAELFEQIYQEQAVVVQSTGYIEHESMLMDRDILTKISQRLPLGVVSDRPRAEVDRALQARKIAHLFQIVISLDDLEQAKREPIPDPWALLEIIRRMTPKPTQCAYIGSTASDILAAKLANRKISFMAVGCLFGAPDKAALRRIFQQYKADVILGHPNHLKELILH